MDYREKRFNSFVEKARKKHGNIYEYNQDEYTDQHTYINIFCTKHNIYFPQIPLAHLKGTGCKLCAKENKKVQIRFTNTNEFIHAMIEEFGLGTFTYEKTKYVNITTPVTVTCPKHGDITKTPDAFLNSHKGCKFCGRERAASKRTSSLDAFILKSRAKFGDKFDFSQSVYTKAILPMDFMCPIHGKVTMTPHDHLVSDTGCPECGKQVRIDKQSLSPEQIIELGRKVHGDKYTYLTETYKGYQEPMDIICPVHGKFSQSLDKHLHGPGCQKCNNRESTGEKKIYEHLCNLLGETEVFRNYIGLFGDKRELDIYVPSLNLAIEFNGLRWHSEKYSKDKNYHLNKTLDTLSKGVYLIHVFEDEWITHEKLVLEKLTLFAHKSTAIKIGARKCIIKEISKSDAESFLNTYHIQGYGVSTIKLGAYYEDVLLGVMTFKKENQNNWELNRFATNYHYLIPGLASKLFTYFIRNFVYNTIKSFLDRRWVYGNNNIYNILGFTLEDILKPDYRYVVGNQRIHKFNFRKQILHKKYGLPLTMTEKEMTKQLGYERIWDCGLIKYTFKK